MPTISLRPKKGISSVTIINCGGPPKAVVNGQTIETSPRLGGEIDITPFNNLTSFTCIGNDITSLVGYENKENLVTLDFSNNVVTGRLENFNGLKNIKNIVCFNNLLTGPIPSLRGCSKLETFRIYNDAPRVGMLSGRMADFNIPGMFTNLRIINYGRNAVTGEIPNVSGLASLATVRVYENLHTGGIPDLSNLPLLSIFACYRNKLTGEIPTSLSNCTNLTEFQCYENMYQINTDPRDYTYAATYRAAPGRGLSGEIPSLANLTKLKDFSVYRNCFTGGIPALPVAALNAPVELQWFLAYDNLLTGSIPNIVADTVNFAKLTKFNCAYNQLDQEIPVINRTVSGVKKLPLLQEFRCEGNKLTGQIPQLSGMTTLITFDCSNNKLNGPIPSLTGLSALQTFICSNNVGTSDATAISGEIPNLTGLNALKIFQCNDTRVSSYAGTTNMPNSITSFYAQNTNLPQIEIDKILKFLALASSVTGVKILNVAGRRPADGTFLIPSYDGPAPATIAGTNFSASGATVTVNSTGHGLIANQLITIVSADGLASIFLGTFRVSATGLSADSFQYTSHSSTATPLIGTGTAILRTTAANSTSGYAYYQLLTVVGRTNGPWNVTINQPI